MARQSDVYGSYIKSDALKLANGQYGVLHLTIKGKPRTVEFDDGGKQRAISFHEDARDLGLNKTNWEAIAELTGKDDDDFWDGAKIELYVDPNVQFGGRRVAAIRVRRPSGVTPPVHSSQAPAAPVTSPAPAPGGPPSSAPAAPVTDKNGAWQVWVNASPNRQPDVSKWREVITNVGKPESAFGPADWAAVAAVMQAPF